MIKRFFLLLLVVSALILVVFLSYSFAMTHEPTPSKRDAEELVRAYDLEKFGAVESSYLHTPDNFAFYNKHRIYVVERALGKREEYVDRHAVIARGEELTAEDEKLAEQYKAHMTSLDPQKVIQILSKHEATVYEDGEKIQTEWVFKTIHNRAEDMILTFESLRTDDIPAFNFSTEGYEQFTDF